MKLKNHGLGATIDAIAMLAAVFTFAALAAGQSMTIPVPTTLPSGSAIIVTIVQTPATAPAPPATSPSNPPASQPASQPSTQPATQPATSLLPDGTPMPGATNTGPAAGTVLTPYTGPQKITVAGTVVNGAEITEAIEVDAANVVFNNCTFVFPAGLENGFGILVDAGANNFVLSNSSLTGGGPGTCQICQNANNAQYISLHVYDTPKTVFYLSGSAAIKGCWLERIGWNGMGVKSNPAKANFTGTDHVDDVYFETGASLIVEDNNFPTFGVPTVINGVTYNVASAAIFTSPYAPGDVTGPVTVSDNYLDGGSYLFQLDGQGSTTITNNILAPDEQATAGYIYPNYIGGTWIWGGNKTPSGATIPIPTGLTPAGTAAALVGN